MTAVVLFWLGVAPSSPFFGGNPQKAPPPLQHEARVALKLVHEPSGLEA